MPAQIIRIDALRKHKVLNTRLDNLYSQIQECLATFDEEDYKAIQSSFNATMRRSNVRVASNLASALWYLRSLRNAAKNE